MAVMLEKSRSVTDVIGRARGLVEDAQSTLLVNLGNIVADNAAKEAEATAAARRQWWTEAREGLRHTFSLAHNYSQNIREVDLSPCNKDKGSACSEIGVGASATEETPPPATAKLLLVRTRLNELLVADEARVVNIATDAVAVADTVGGRSGDRGGPLDLAVAEKQRCSSEAIQRCADAIEAFRSAPSAYGGENKHIIAANPVPKNISTGGSTGSTSGIVRHADTRNLQEEFESFWLRLEAEAVQLVVASFGTEQRQLVSSPSASVQPAVNEVIEIGQKPSSRSSSSSLLRSDYFPQRDLMRSQLDLRRAARVRAFARALGEMVSRGRETLLDDLLEVTFPTAVALDILGGLVKHFMIPQKNIGSRE